MTNVSKKVCSCFFFCFPSHIDITNQQNLSPKSEKSQHFSTQLRTLNLDASQTSVASDKTTSSLEPEIQIEIAQKSNSLHGNDRDQADFSVRSDIP